MRIRLTYTIRTLILIMTSVAVLVGLWARMLTPYWDQMRVAQKLVSMNAKIRFEKPSGFPGALAELSGARDVVELDLADIDDVTVIQAISAFPRLRVLALGGDNISDARMGSIPVCEHLRLLLLDSTLCTERGVSEFRARYPEVQVHLSERRAMYEIPEEMYNSRPRYGAIRESPLVNETSFMDHNHFLTIWGFNLSPSPLPDVDLPVERLKSIGKLTHLEHLNLCCTTMDDSDLAKLSRLTKLRSLNIPGSAVTGDGLSLLNCRDLIRLDMRNTPYTGNNLIKFRKLQYLNLGYTRLTDEDLASICASCNKLVSLDIRHTNVTDKGIKSIYELSSLKNLFLSEIKDEQREVLQTRLPECYIVVQD